MSIEMDDLVSSTSEKDGDQEEMASLEQIERCLDACGFGKYQWGLLGISFLGVLANAFAMVNSHYVLNFNDNKHHDRYKQFPYIMLLFGIMISSILLGFLSDSFGRRKVTIICFAGLSVATFFKGLVQYYEINVFAKFCEGIFLGGTSVASTTLQAEFQPEKSRDRIIFTLNFFVAITHLLVVLLDVNIFLRFLFYGPFDEFFGLHPWHIYISLTSLFSLIASGLYALLPESPKYDFNHGRYENALRTLKKIYSVNTGKSSDEFPYQILGMTDNEFRTHSEKVQATCSNVKLLFKQPLLKYLLIIVAAHFIFTLSYNTIILWHPTLLSAVVSAARSNSTFLCNAFDETHESIPRDGREVYHYIGNYIGMFVFGLIPYIGITIFINRGKKIILLLSIFVCSSLIISMYWINFDFGNILVFGIFLAMGQSFAGIAQTITVEIFPVYTKSFSLSLLLTANTMGAVLAELMIFSLLKCGCALGFIVAAVMTSAAIFVLFLPK